MRLCGFTVGGVYPICAGRFRARLHQVSVSMLRQLYDDTSNSVLVENNGATQKLVETPFYSGSILNENTIAGIIAELSQY